MATRGRVQDQPVDRDIFDAVTSLALLLAAVATWALMALGIPVWGLIGYFAGSAAWRFWKAWRA